MPPKGKSGLTPRLQKKVEEAAAEAKRKQDDDENKMTQNLARNARAKNRSAVSVRAKVPTKTTGTKGAKSTRGAQKTSKAADDLIMDNAEVGSIDAAGQDPMDEGEYAVHNGNAAAAKMAGPSGVRPVHINGNLAYQQEQAEPVVYTINPLASGMNTSSNNPGLPSSAQWLNASWTAVPPGGVTITQNPLAAAGPVQAHVRQQGQSQSAMPMRRIGAANVRMRSNDAYSASANASDEQGQGQSAMPMRRIGAANVHMHGNDALDAINMEPVSSMPANAQANTQRGKLPRGSGNRNVSNAYAAAHVNPVTSRSLAADDTVLAHAGPSTQAPAGPDAKPSSRYQLLKSLAKRYALNAVKDKHADLHAQFRKVQARINGEIKQADRNKTPVQRLAPELQHVMNAEETATYNRLALDGGHEGQLKSMVAAARARLVAPSTEINMVNANLNEHHTNHELQNQNQDTNQGTNVPDGNAMQDTTHAQTQPLTGAQGSNHGVAAIPLTLVRNDDTYTAEAAMGVMPTATLNQPAAVPNVMLMEVGDRHKRAAELDGAVPAVADSQHNGTRTNKKIRKQKPTQVANTSTVPAARARQVNKLKQMRADIEQAKASNDVETVKELQPKLLQLEANYGQYADQPITQPAAPAQQQTDASMVAGLQSQVAVPLVPLTPEILSNLHELQQTIDDKLAEIEALDAQLLLLPASDEYEYLVRERLKLVDDGQLAWDARESLLEGLEQRQRFEALQALIDAKAAELKKLRATRDDLVNQYAASANDKEKADALTLEIVKVQNSIDAAPKALKELQQMQGTMSTGTDADSDTDTDADMADNNLRQNYEIIRLQNDAAAAAQVAKGRKVNETKAMERLLNAETNLVAQDNELTRLRQELDAEQAERTRLAAANEGLEMTLKAKDGNLLTLLSQVQKKAALEAELAAVKQEAWTQLAEAEQAFKKLHTNAERAHGEAQIALVGKDKLIGELTQQMLQIEHEWNGLSTRFHETAAAKEAAEKKAEDLSQKLGEATAAKGRVDKDLADQKRLTEAKEQDLQTLNAELTDAKNNLAALLKPAGTPLTDAERRAWQAEVSALQTQISSLNEAIGNQNTTSEQQKIRITTLEGEQHRQTGEINVLNEQLAAAKLEAAANAVAGQTLASELAAVKGQLQQAHADLAEAKGTVAAHESTVAELAQAKAEVAQLKAQAAQQAPASPSRSRLEQQIAAKNQEVARLTDDANRQKTAMSELHAKVTAQQEGLHNRNVQIAKHNAAMQDIQNRLASAQRKLQQYQQQPATKPTPRPPKPPKPSSPSSSPSSSSSSRSTSLGNSWSVRPAAADSSSYSDDGDDLGQCLDELEGKKGRTGWPAQQQYPARRRGEPDCGPNRYFNKVSRRCNCYKDPKTGFCIQ